jgi:hypothetical protein
VLVISSDADADGARAGPYDAVGGPFEAGNASAFGSGRAFTDAGSALGVAGAWSNPDGTYTGEKIEMARALGLVSDCTRCDVLDRPLVIEYSLQTVSQAHPMRPSM